ncbi:Mycobacterium numidiamassiliense ORFan [Mycobacterium numidiamassiliense]|uniref:Mycobacterium numidiamassiliense ORFan n=1 Tax=Mycobacterium numidiamassiliense TaxID=1841861 RepID=A0A2U3P945_9MYCO|nr:Mycobacterium numidiamassiliense ORFan [Mycobacterium numidiamassiliense]
MEILWPAFRTSMKCGERCSWMPEQSIDGLDAVKTRKQNRRYRAGTKRNEMERTRR